MHFFLLTNYFNYVVFDEALVLLDRFKKSNSKIRKGARFWKQRFDNILFKMLYF